MKPKKLHNDPKNKGYRIKLRKNMTLAEAYLWKELQRKKLDGKKFRRQHGIGNYIVDFYCMEENLVIELDGKIHNSKSAIIYDEKRTAFLNNNGIMVIRFKNKMVFENLPDVLQEIRNSFKEHRNVSK
ncbi:MAG TPA: endonuclease domain-containing protein [Arenibacter sp.]|nr:endonuclease domain-containing protein [Arenibacter sp.]